MSVTLKHLKGPQVTLKQRKKNKNILKAGSIQENIEINDQYSDEFLNTKDI